MTSSTATLTSASYGKDLVKILRLVRSPTDPSSHTLVEYSIKCLLSSNDGFKSPTNPSLDLSKSYTQADNSPVVATDSIKNTLNYLSKTLPASIVLIPELFSLHISNHFLSKYDHIKQCEIQIIQLKWSRIVLKEGEHKHSFVRDGDDKRIVNLKAQRNSDENGDGKDSKIINFTSGIKDLLVLKSTGSAFHGFYKDEFTTLKPVGDRIFSTAVECNFSISLPQIPLSQLISPSNLSILPNFNSLHSLVLSHTLRVFALDNSASVQATMFRMAEAILGDKESKSLDNGKSWQIKDVEYSLPNKHYIPIDLSWTKERIDNLDEKNAEVFLPSAHPSGLIKAKMSRPSAAKL